MPDMSPEIDSLLIAEVVDDTWNTYLGAVVDPSVVSEAATDESQIAGSIRISGDAVWEVTLLGTWSSAEEATRRMLGSSNHVREACGHNAATREFVMDAWGELVNTLAGNLKAAFDFGAHTLSIPEVSMPEGLPDEPSPTVPGEVKEFLFGWDGYLARIRIKRITPA